MTKKDISELKRRFKKEECTFTKMSGCYVDGNKNKVVSFTETFLNLEDEEFYKYLELANKTLSGTLGNNLLELKFPLAEENNGGRQQFLMGLKASKLENADLVDRFYDLVIESYSYTGNYLILLFHDCYDVITRTNDNLKLDESEEVYEYLLCAICPVSLSKPGLGYRADENRIGPRIRDWVVCPPDSGFLFPAFTDRSSDIHATLFYTKDVKAPHAEFMEAGLGCDPRRTATEQKMTFHSIVKEAFHEDEEAGDTMLLNIQESLNERIDTEEESPSKDVEPQVLTATAIKEVLEDLGIPSQTAAEIEETYQSEFSEELPVVEHLIDTKALEAKAKREKELELQKEVAALKQKIEENASDELAEDASVDIILKVKPDKVDQIRSEIIDGHNCLIVPIDDDEHAAINGIQKL